MFRAVPPWEHKYSAGKRSGLSGMTLSAEGVWRASTGQLCMVGCLGVGAKACHSRVCLYVQTTFTATRRSLTVGQITRVDGSGGVAHFPLTIKRTVHPTELWSRFGVSGGAPLSMAYNYTKVRQASEFLRRSEPFQLGAALAKSLLSYPKKDDSLTDDAMSLSNLAGDLTLHVSAGNGSSGRSFSWRCSCSDLSLAGPRWRRRLRSFLECPASSVGAKRPLGRRRSKSPHRLRRRRSQQSHLSSTCPRSRSRTSWRRSRTGSSRSQPQPPSSLRKNIRKHQSLSPLNSESV